MEYAVEYRHNSLPMQAFRQRYQNREKYIAYCKECPKYDTVWSCPPLQFETDDFLARFAWVNVAGVKINLSPKIIKYADTSEKIKYTGWKILSAVKMDMEEKMRGMEKILPKSISLSSGGCTICKNCTRKANQPCRWPDKMRYSLDAFGFDLSAITRDMLGIEILWCKNRLPDYFTLIHGILTVEEMPVDIWKKYNMDRSV